MCIPTHVAWSAADYTRYARYRNHAFVEGTCRAEGNYQRWVQARGAGRALEATIFYAELAEMEPPVPALRVSFNSTV